MNSKCDAIKVKMNLIILGLQLLFQSRHCVLSLLRPLLLILELLTEVRDEQRRDDPLFKEFVLLPSGCFFRMPTTRTMCARASFIPVANEKLNSVG